MGRWVCMLAADVDQARGEGDSPVRRLVPAFLIVLALLHAPARLPAASSGGAGLGVDLWRFLPGVPEARAPARARRGGSSADRAEELVALRKGGARARFVTRAVGADPAFRPGQPSRLLPPVEQGGGVRSQTIFKDDRRTPVGDTTQFPFSTICLILAQFPSKNVYASTGTLIAPDVVLTAGHVVYNHDEGGWAEAMEVAPGADGQNSPFGISAVLDISAFRGWVEDAAFDHDMGLIYLETPLGDDAGWMGFAYYRDLFHAFINMAAYHTDLDNGTRQHLDSGRVQRDFRRQIEYRLDTAPGSSGAGAYVIDRNRRFVVATNSWQSSRTNGGCRINRAKFQALSAAVD